MKNIDIKTIVYQHKDQMYRFAISILKNETDAQDVLQDIFLKVWERRKAITIDVNWKVYLMQATRNKCFDFMKKNRRVTESIVEDSNKYGYYTDVQTDFEHKEMLCIVEKYISQLSEREQSILHLKEYEQLSYEEFAEIEALSVNNVRTILSRTRKLLKEKFEYINFYITD